MTYQFNKNEILARLSIDSDNINIMASNSYLRSYPDFVKYFKDLDTLTTHNLVIAAHFTYGWMPTVFEFQIGDLDEAVTILNFVKTGNGLKREQIETLKLLLNNSLVGTSKLLHFIAPDHYPIWDSRVFRYVTKHEPYLYSISNIDSYLNFTNLCRDIASDPEFQGIHDRLEKKLYPMSKIRSMELVMFTKGLNTKRSKIHT